MGRWNATCGVSLHAELLGRSLLKLGHEVLVYAPTIESASRDWHHRVLEVEDEDWVYRVYCEVEENSKPNGGWIDCGELLSRDYEVLIVEGYPRFPIVRFKEVAYKVKKKSLLVLVSHFGRVEDVKPYTSVEWDAIVVFDDRFTSEIMSPLGGEIVKKTFEIPYPYAIVDVKGYRPGFSRGKLLFFSFGRQPEREYLDYIRALDTLRSNYEFYYWVIRSNSLLSIKRPYMVQWCRRPSMLQVNSYIKGSDLHLIPKGETSNVVVSSTLAQTLSSATPTIVPDTRHFEKIPVNESGVGPVVKYKKGDVRDLVGKIRLLIEDEKLRREVSRRALEYAVKNSGVEVAKKFLKLFKTLRSNITQP